jgi:predicted TIM-barrel fold metal-dependent hydrolase
MQKIDIFNHIWPAAFHEKLKQAMGSMVDITRRSEAVPMMTDLEERFRVMDMFEDYYQILSLASPPLELIKDTRVSAELARVGNDGMQELCDKYPARFPGFIASLPMNDPEAALNETRRVIEELGALGIQVFTNVSGKPLDAPEFRPLFELMAGYNKPVWMHPARGANFPDYLTEDRSLYEIWWTFGWPY